MSQTWCRWVFFVGGPRKRRKSVGEGGKDQARDSDCRWAHCLRGLDPPPGPLGSRVPHTVRFAH